MTNFLSELLDIAGTTGDLNAVLNAHEALMHTKREQNALTVEADVQCYHRDANKVLQVIDACTTPRQLQTLYSHNYIAIDQNQIIQIAWNSRMATLRKPTN